MNTNAIAEQHQTMQSALKAIDTCWERGDYQNFQQLKEGIKRIAQLKGIEQDDLINAVLNQYPAEAVKSGIHPSVAQTLSTGAGKSKLQKALKKIDKTWRSSSWKLDIVITQAAEMFQIPAKHLADGLAERYPKDVEVMSSWKNSHYLNRFTQSVLYAEMQWRNGAVTLVHTLPRTRSTYPDIALGETKQALTDWLGPTALQIDFATWSLGKKSHSSEFNVVKDFCSKVPPDWEGEYAPNPSEAKLPDIKVITQTRKRNHSPMTVPHRGVDMTPPARPHLAYVHAPSQIDVDNSTRQATPPTQKQGLGFFEKAIGMANAAKNMTPGGVAMNVAGAAGKAAVNGTKQAAEAATNAGIEAATGRKVNPDVQWSADQFQQVWNNGKNYRGLTHDGREVVITAIQYRRFKSQGIPHKRPNR